jgi:hypothetical protein
MDTVIEAITMDLSPVRIWWFREAAKAGRSDMRVCERILVVAFAVHK